MASSTTETRKCDSGNVQADRRKKKNQMDKDIPEPPDGGWGWVIVAASFLCNLVLDGSAYSFGIFFTEFVEYYNAPKAKVAWVGSLLYGCYLIVGPLASVLTNRYGCRVVVIIGSIVSCVAFLLSTVAPSVDVLIVTYGIIGGIGFGLIYLPAVVIVGSYFSKKRALATGIAVSGSGVGAFVFAPLCQMLLETYDWRGTLAILAGLSLNCAVFGALMLPLESETQRKLLPKKPEDQVETRPVDSTQEVNQDKTDIIKCETILSLENAPHSSTYLYRNSKSPDDNNNNMEFRSCAYGRSCFCADNHNCSKDQSWMRTVSETVDISNQLSSQSWMCDKDGYCRVSIGSLHQKGHGETVDKVTIFQPVACSCPQVYLSSSKISKRILGTISKILDFSLLRNKAFLLFCIANFIGNVGFLVPYIYIVDSSMLKGISSESAAFLLSLIGISNTAGRLLFGWLADRPRISGLLVNNITTALTGVCVLCAPFCNTYVTIAAACCLFGLFLSASVSLTSTILIDLLGLDKLTDAFGLLSLFLGMSSILGPPFSGFVYDLTGSYDIPFYTAGVLLALSSVACFMIPLVQKQPSATATPETTGAERTEENQYTVTSDMADVL